MIRIMLSRKLGELRLSQADLSRMTQIRPSTINEYYHDIAERVNLEHMDLICEALNCDLNEILVREPNETPRISVYRSGRRISGSGKRIQGTGKRISG